MPAHQTFPNFDTIGEKLERLIVGRCDPGEQPVASILRYYLDRSEGFIPDLQVLVVRRSSQKTPATLHFDALTNANALARQAAVDLVPGWDGKAMEVH